MEPLMRGVIEQAIDSNLTDESLEELQVRFEMLKPIITSREDAMFGFIVGAVVATFSNLYSMILRRKPTDQEVDEMGKILQERSALIKSRILETLV